MAKDNKRRGGYWFGINLTGPGMIFTVGFISLAIGMGILLSRGITPRSTLSDPGETGELEIVQETPGPDRNNLQLKTIKFKECGKYVTIDFLLDRSGSMGDTTPTGITKLTRLKEAVGELITNADDSSIIGIQSFSGTSITDDVPISYLKDVKGIIYKKLNALVANGATPTYNALAFSRDRLKEALPKFKDRKFNFILISDGAPCPGVGCLGNNSGPNQDPRLYNPNPADEIKEMGVTVWTLGIFDYNQSQDPNLSDLLKSIATTPSHYFAANNADETSQLLKQITNRICNDLM